MSRRDNASAAQITVIQNMIRSHVITPGERQKFMAAIANGIKKGRASEAVEWLKETIPARKAREDVGELCHFCDDEYAVVDVAIERDQSIAGPTGHYTTATRREVPCCPACADGREVVES